jgi:acetyl-CoA carboxylase, biotin carboxylase subunit
MKKVLVANRGEIAVRILRACREMGFERQRYILKEMKVHCIPVMPMNRSALAHSAAAKSYLNAGAVLQAALQLGADAIHPGIWILI